MKSLFRQRRRPAPSRRGPFRFGPTLDACEDRILLSNGFLQGYALGPVGQPLPNAIIELHTDLNAPPVATATTDANGYYQFNDVVPGTYSLVEVAPGYTASGATIDSTINPATAVSTADHGTAIQVTVLDPDTQSIHLTAGRQPYPYAIAQFVLNASANNAASPYNSYTGAAHGDTIQQYPLTLTGNQGSVNSILAVCTDLFHSSGTNYTVTPSLTPNSTTLTTNIGRIGYLYNHYTRFLQSGAPSNDPSINGAGLQLATWALEYDANPNVTPGAAPGNNFQVLANTPQSVIDAANYFLALSVGKSEHVYFLNSSAPKFTGPAQGMLATDLFTFKNDAAPTINVSGTKFQDLTGNGFSSDDTPLAGVTIQLYRDSLGTGVLDTANDALVATAVTAADGSYSFPNLPAGTYFVKEVVPAGWIATGGPANGYYTVNGRDTSGANFDNFQLISISGKKYNDLTGNGISVDDTPLAGVTINLFKDGGLSPIATATTAADGSFSFNDLAPGVYSVQEVVPAGSTQTGGIGGYTVNATSGLVSTGNDFANFRNVTITGTKYTDITGNGFSADDTPLAGVVINLFKDGGLSPVATTTTGADGRFSFSNLGPGVYSVQEVVPTGWVQTGGTGGYTVNATSGLNSTGNDFDNFQLISISGKKYTDLTGNGFSADDTPLAGVVINLYKDGGLSPVATTTTGADGSFSFNDLAPGTYSVQEVVPTGWTQTGGIGGYVIAATSGLVSTGNDFDNFRNVTISGTKYTDITGNGFSSDDTPLAGVTINLYKGSPNGTPIASTVTKADGTYSFTNIGPGTYYVKEVVPTGWVATDGPSGGAYTVVAASDQNAGGKDFANFQLASISGKKFLDLSGNGFSADDTPLAGVTIQLYKDTLANGVLDTSKDKLVATAVTKSDGSFGFANLAPGVYFVQEVVPSGYVRTGPVQTGYYTVNVTSGSNTTDRNFDNYKTADCNCNVTCITYVINGCRTVSDLRGNTRPGDQVQVFFTVPRGETAEVTLVSYVAPGASFDPNTAAQQTIYQQSTGTFAAGRYSLTVTIPNSYYQIDFVCGKAIDHFGPAGSNIFYSAQNRLLSADNGGTKAFGPSSLSGFVYVDCNANGVKNSGEAGIGGVVLKLTGVDYQGNAVSQTTTTNASGAYTFNGLAPSNSAGYTITEVPNQAVLANYLDGKDSAGTLGGSAGNDTITRIVVDTNESGQNYNFGEVQAGSLSGLVYVDNNRNGRVDLGEGDIGGVTITLTGTDDLGRSVCLTTQTDADGVYSFTNLRPGTYTLAEGRVSGYSQGYNSVGTAGGSLSGTDKIGCITLSACDNDGYNYNFGEYTSYCSSPTASGVSASVGYWQNKAGQALINAFNGSTNSTALSNWLASSFPNLFGSGAGSRSLAGLTNAQVASYVQSLANVTGPRLDSEVLAAALNVYATTSSLGGSAAKSYGFKVTSAGLGATAFNVGTNGAAFGVADNAKPTVLQLLQSADSQAVGGVLYAANPSLRPKAFNVFSGVNDLGEI